MPQEDCPADGKPTVESSCGRYVIPLYPSPWNDDLKDNSSCNYQILKKNLTNIICVELKIRVSVVINLELTFKKAAGGWLTVEVKVCLDFKLEVVIDMEAILHNFATNYTYEAVGVTFSEWKAKDGECKKCDGGGGPFMIESVCEEKEHSCRGQKNKSKKSMDCAKYCSSSAQVVAAVSNLILAMWISISYNF